MERYLDPYAIRICINSFAVLNAKIGRHSIRLNLTSVRRIFSVSGWLVLRVYVMLLSVMDSTSKGC